jgi:hypothetical protein
MMPKSKIPKDKVLGHSHLHRDRALDLLHGQSDAPTQRHGSGTTTKLRHEGADGSQPERPFPRLGRTVSSR